MVSRREFPDDQRPREIGHASDPCLDLQADISALLDRELDDSRVRRVLVHVEICPRCNRFLRSLRTQIELHRELWEGIDAEQALVEEDPFAGDLFEAADLEPELAEADGPRGGEPGAESFLDRMLAESRERLAEVLYQLGRAYVLLNSSPEFFSVTVREPVPIPEFRLRGKAILAGTGSLRDAAPEAMQDGWAEADSLLDGKLDRSPKNLDKAQCLLEQALRLRPGSCSTLVMLGQCYLYRCDHSRARFCFQGVIRQTRKDGGPKDPLTRVPLRTYAIESLGNICLVEDQPEEALRYFRRVVASGAMNLHPTFATSLLNVAWAALQVGRNEEAAAAFEEFYRRFDSRRQETAEMLALKPEVRRLVDADPALKLRLAESCPEWFGTTMKLADRTHVSFQKVYSGEECQEGRVLQGDFGRLPPAAGGGE